MPEKFEQKIHDALFENTGSGSGHSKIKSYIPDGIDYELYTDGPPAVSEIPAQVSLDPGVVDDDDEFGIDEPEVVVEYDWAIPEKRTFDYSGSPKPWSRNDRTSGVWITSITLSDGRKLNIDKIPEELYLHFGDHALEDLSLRKIL